MTTVLGRMVTYLEKLLTIKSYEVLQNHLKNKIHYISATRVPMATKFGRMVAHLDELLPIKSHDPLIT